ncbi:MAG: HisA/HisF-related TIM barrel protein [Methanolinea sp.]|nr:HisA/HisF-related TIM barrel protein [Methanolinea sp.]
MDLILAMDLKGGLVVHGSSGNRRAYLPLTWGLSPTAEPEGYVRAVSPRAIYIADLDRIMRTGENTAEVLSCSRQVSRCLLDRGAAGPSDFLHHPRVTDIASTESSEVDFALYPAGFLSVDIRDSRVIPSGDDPLDLLSRAGSWNFSGAIVLDVGAVGTGKGPDISLLGKLRGAYGRELLYGGGISGPGDLDTLAALGYDGAIVATAVHRGKIPHDAVRRGTWS